MGYLRACLLAGNIDHRLRNATVVCLWPSSQSLSWCIPYPLDLTLCLFAWYFVSFLFSLLWGEVPSDGLTVGGFLRFPKTLLSTPSYPPPFYLLLFNFLLVWSISKVYCWIPCLITSGVDSVQALVDKSKHLFLVSSAIFPIHKVTLP